MIIYMYKHITDEQLRQFPCFALHITSFKLHYNIYGDNFHAMHAAQLKNNQNNKQAVQKQVWRPRLLITFFPFQGNYLNVLWHSTTGCQIHFSWLYKSVAHPGEAPLIFRPNWSLKGKKKFWDFPPVISGFGWPSPPLIWRSGSAAAIEI